MIIIIIIMSYLLGIMFLFKIKHQYYNFQIQILIECYCKLLLLDPISFYDSLLRIITIKTIHNTVKRNQKQ